MTLETSAYTSRPDAQLVVGMLACVGIDRYASIRTRPELLAFLIGIWSWAGAHPPWAGARPSRALAAGVYTSATMFRVDSELSAAEFISRSFADKATTGVVTDLLRLAGGHPAKARHHLTSDQVRLLKAHRVTSLIPPDWTAEVPDGAMAQYQRQLAINRLQLWATSDEVVRLLNEHQIESRLLKGLATARLDYQRPELRDTGDIDLLVRPEELAQVVELLCAEGSVYNSPDHVDPDLGKGVTLVHPTKLQIDLHTRLTGYEVQDIEVLMQNPNPIPGAVGLALPLEMRLLHAAGHLVYSPPGTRRLSGVADISAIVDRNDLDWNSVRELAKELNVESVSGLGLLVEGLLRDRDVTHLGEWQAPSLLERLSFARTRRALIMEKVLALSNLETMNARSRYVWQWILPSRDLLETRGGAFAYYRKMLPVWAGGQGQTSDRSL